MESELTCPSFADIITIIDTTSKKNCEFLRRFVEHVSLYRDLMRKARDAAGLATPEYIASHVEGKPPNGELPVVVSTDFSRAWRQLLDGPLNPVTALRATTHVFSKLRSSSVANADEYASQCSDLLAKARESFGWLTAAEETARLAHAAYFETGKQLEAAFAQRLPTYPDLVRRFPQAQAAAVAAHREHNAMRGHVTTAFAEYLSDFERIEAGRSAIWARGLREFQTELAAASKRCKKSAKKITRLLDIAENSEARLFENTSFLKDAVASLTFQVVPVPGEACRLLDMKKVYREEIKAKGVLYEVTVDFRGGGSDYLDAVPTEVVVALEDRGDVKKCKNINECIGLLPSSVLKPI